MTVSVLQGPLVPMVGSSKDGSGSQPLFSEEEAEDLRFTIHNKTPTNSLSLDWSDFPVLSQYKEAMPVPPPTPLRSNQHFSASPTPTRRSCSCWPNTPTWSDDDTVSLSVSSDDDNNSSLEESSSEIDSTVHVQRDLDRNKNNKSVSFSSVLEIRSYNLVLGDHPCCCSLALELGWDHQQEEVLDFELYESSRQCQRRKCFRLYSWDRRRLLELHMGFCEEELLTLQEKRRSAFLPPPVSCEASTQCSIATMRKVSTMKNALSSFAA